jgi:(1->4)-alpha-D-glucan 1-alpha-D-glucosylmutase
LEFTGQLLLKIASPGVPDFFQGTENWTLTLVDPDNRHPVDFDHARGALDRIRQGLSACDTSGNADAVEAWLDRCLQPTSAHDESNEGVRALVAELLANRQDGTIKAFCTQILLRLRRRLPNLFTRGTYLPLGAEGAASEHAVAFARMYDNQAAIALAPRWTVRLAGFAGPPPIGDVWSEATLIVPQELADRTWRDVLTGQQVHCDTAGRMLVKDVLSQLPVALLVAAPN